MPDYREPEEQPFDPATGEVIEGTATREPPPTPPSRELGRAADGGIIPGPARSVGNFIDLLEDGQLSHEMHEELKSLAEQIRNVAMATGGKAKGTMSLNIALTCEGDAFHIGTSFKAKAPELPRRRSIMWQDDAGNFTRFPPNQTQMFGSAAIRRVG